jgi:hypothetical protein
MPRSIIRTITTAIAFAALAAPTALARPADTPPAVAKAAAAQHKRAVSLGANSRVVDPATRPRPAQPPTWPVNPQPLTPPAAKDTHGGDGGDWTTIGLGIAGSLLAIGAIAGIARRTRRIGRARITA